MHLLFLIVVLDINIDERYNASTFGTNDDNDIIVTFVVTTAIMIIIIKEDDDDNIEDGNIDDDMKANLIQLQFFHLSNSERGERCFESK